MKPVWIAPPLALGVLLSGCQGAQLATGVSAYAAERYRLPPLGQIDRIDIEVRKKTWIPAKLYDPRVAPVGSDGAVERLVTTRMAPGDATSLVESVNDVNRWWQNPPLNLAPAIYRRDPAPPKPRIVFWNKDAVVREIQIDGDYFVTTLDSRTIRREIGSAEANLIARYSETNREGAGP